MELGKWRVMVKELRMKKIKRKGEEENKGEEKVEGWRRKIRKRNIERKRR